MANLGLQNNNPGNLRDPATGNFRVFNTPDEGQQALISDIKLKQSGQSSHIKPGQSISDFANVWAPASDNNNPQNYAHVLATNLGVDPSHPFDQVEPEKLAGAIRVAEGTSTMPISSQPKDRNSIIKANVLKLQNANATPEDIEAYVKSATQESAGGNSTTGQTQTDLPQPHPDLLQQVGNVVNTIFPGKQVGESIGTLAGYIQAKINDAMKGTDTASQYDTSGPSVLQTAADVGQIALMVGGVPGVAAGGSTLARLGIAGAEGTAFGGLNAVAGGSTDMGEIGKQAAIGGVLGAGTAGLIEGGMAVSKAISGRAARTAEEILATPASEVGKLPAREQQFWHQNESTQSLAKAKLAGDQAVDELQKTIISKQGEIGTMSKEQAVGLKEDTQQLFKDKQQQYKSAGEQDAKNSPNLSKVLPSDDLIKRIDTEFPQITGEGGKPIENPIAADLKKQLGISENKNLTNQEILDKAREMMQDVSKTSLQGNKSYSQKDYETLQKYALLMESIGENGVDMKVANALWKEWKPISKKMVTQIRPWDMSGVNGTPLGRSILTATKPVTRGEMAISKSNAQEMISVFEKELKLEPGSLTKATQDLVDQLEASKLSKEQLIQANKEALAQLRQDIKNKKYDLSTKVKKEAWVKAIIKKIVGAAVGAGVGATVGGTTGIVAGGVVGEMVGGGL